jgi:nitrite reductase/ring-hydroxylating ferredoxin subunit
MGDIEDIGGRAALVCPWHGYRVTVASGEKLYEGLDDKFRPCGWKSVGTRQRVHTAARIDDGIYVTLNTDPTPVESDRYACA